MTSIKSRAIAMVAAPALAMSLTTMSATSAEAAPRGDSHIVGNTSAAKVTSLVTGTTEDGRKFRGSFTPTKFVMQDGQLVAQGVLEGRLRGTKVEKDVALPLTAVNGVPLDGSAAGDASARRAAEATAAKAGAGCDILNLTLAPLDLNLLGLEVHLDQVVLDIIAKPGAGQLLGNLLCAVAGLLDGGLSGLLGKIGDLLNQILGSLNLGS